MSRVFPEAEPRQTMGDCSEQCRHSDTALLAGFYLEGLALPLLGSLGIIGNILAILVLRSDILMMILNTNYTKY